MLKITLLTENTVRRRGLLAEHGLSLWIEHDQTRLLFDTGQSDCYIKNAQTLGIDLQQAQAIVISHGHYDHGGGLPDFQFTTQRPIVYIQPSAFEPKFSAVRQPDGSLRSIGFPFKNEDIPQLAQHLGESQLVQEIGHNLYLISGIEATHDFEKSHDLLLHQIGGQLEPDPMQDEQILVCTCDQGMVIVLGCSHPGVVNSIEKARKLFGNLPVRGIIGGMHLEHANDEQLTKTIDYLESCNQAQIIPLHCTGNRAVQEMIKRLGARVTEAHVGDVVIFP